MVAPLQDKILEGSLVNTFFSRGRPPGPMGPYVPICMHMYTYSGTYIGVRDCPYGICCPLVR